MNSIQTYDLRAFKYSCMGGTLFLVSTLLLSSGTSFKLTMGLFFITTIVNSVASYFIFRTLYTYIRGKKFRFIYYPTVLFVIGYAVLSAYAFLNELLWDYFYDLFRSGTMFYIPNGDGSYLVTFYLLLPVVTILFFVFSIAALFWKKTVIENPPTNYFIMSLLLFVIMGIIAIFVDTGLVCDHSHICRIG